ncbi:MAG: hypothetical protein ABI042_12450 [Verrucomicrobiota bacterium]
MKTNEILDEIYQLRAEHARECDYDIHKIFDQLRDGTKELAAEGWKIVSLDPREPAETSYALREEPPKKSE